jgi:predicted nucleic acid-binding Zn finger protein
MRIWHLRHQILFNLALTGVLVAPSLGIAQGFEPPVRPGDGLTAGNFSLPLTRDDRRNQVTSIEIVLPRNDLGADGQTSTPVTVRLVDEAGTLLKGLAVATVEFNGARVRVPGRLTDESGPDRGDLDRVLPGVQIEIRDGIGSFELIAPSQPADVNLRVTVGSQQAQGVVRFVADKRDMVGIGVIEGIIALQNRANPNRTDDGIEKDLRQIQRDFAGGRGSAALSAEMYFKGLVKGDYLLTLAYDSDKATRSRLFRDIQPEEYYPVYGDSSIKGFDARSASKLFVRVDKDRSYLLYGDYTTATQFESMALSNYQRSLTGLKWHYETNAVSANVFAARDNLRQVIEEQPARGVSGPYFVSNLFGVRFTEKVEVITRDRNQPAVILSVQLLQRFVDYTFEPFSGQVLFKAPIPTIDSNFNPISIRITYEVDQGGSKFWVAGADAQLKLTDNAAVGASFARDENPSAPYTLAGLNASLRLGANTVALAEVARADGRPFTSGLITSLAPTADPTTGNAARVEFRTGGQQGSLRVYVAKTDIGFNNPGASLAPGRTEASARGEYKITKDVRVFGEATRTETKASDTNGSGGQRDVVTAGLGWQATPTVDLDLFGRKSKDVGNPPLNSAASPSGLGTFNPAAGQNLNPFDPNAQTAGSPTLTNANSIGLRGRWQFSEKSSLFGEFEREVSGESRNRIALGGDYQMYERVRLYGRHEWVSASDSLLGPEATNTTRQTVFGVSSDYMTGGNVFSEYRVRDAIGGYEAQAAVGLRNTFPLRQGIALQTSLERVQTTSLRNAPVNLANPVNIAPTKATAAGVGVEVTTDPDWKASARVEARQDTQNNQVLAIASGTLKLDYNLTALARNYYNRTSSRSSNADRTENRLQLGVAWRDTDVNVWSWLGRYEYRYEKEEATGLLTRANVFAGTFNYHPSRPLWVSGQAAIKLTNDGPDGKYTAWLLGGRVIYDITERWDVSAAAFTLNDKFGLARVKQQQYAAGVEAGYLLRQNLWLSAGYNWRGFSSDLTLDDYTQRGAYIRLRAKFDETLLGVNRDDDRTRIQTPIPPAAKP